MSKKLPISELAKKILTIKDKFALANLEVLAKLGSLAQSEAIKNSKQQFIGRGGRNLSGRLMNSIFWKVDKYNKKDTAFVGTRGIPYGKIHEFGGDIRAKSAKFLWIKTPYAYKKFKNFTPSDFYRSAKQDPDHFFYKSWFGSKGAAMYKTPSGRTLSALFFLKKQVKMPQRSYLTPAASHAASKYKEYFNDVYGDLFKE
jgi:phage gpG-like protein